MAKLPRMSNTKNKTCIIIGASHAGSQMAISLRQKGWEGGIILIGDENHPPYHRPPLSKDFLKGGKDIADILLRPFATYENANIDLLLGQSVQKIDREDRLIFFRGGETLQYDKLVLAMGARPRPLPVKGAGQDNIFYLRSADDVLAIKARVRDGAHALIIGGGYIGLETAASLRAQNMRITILEREARILQRVTAPIISDFYRRIHNEEGVEIIEGCTVSEIADDLSVKTNMGEFAADMIIVGIGVLPNQELAEMAGLEIGNGVKVNQYCQTSDENIYAIGDVAWHYNPLYRRDLRLESVPNTTEMAKTATAHIMGEAKPHAALPWFWSDQYDLKLQIAGLSDGYDDIIVRGAPDSGRSFAAFYFKVDKLLAVDAINRPQEYMIGKKLIPLCLSGRKTIDKKALADEAVALKTLLK